jgi:hypothetical protein
MVGVALATGAGGWLVGSQIAPPADATAAHQAPDGVGDHGLRLERKTLTAPSSPRAR